jgi:2-polyprenyl-6-methoxyphenol hydroxylase-like FAD-dependent oxidoreductase
MAGATTMRRAVVIGAGIGGLGAASALARSGWTVTVLERAGVLDPVGAGLGVAPNALRALDVLGLGDALRARSAVQGEAGIQRSDGAWIYRTSDDAIRRRFGDPVVVAVRADLVGVLAGAVPPDALRLGNLVTAVRPGDRGRPAEVALAGEETLPADLVVAADGVRSTTRATCFPEHPGPRRLDLVAWRFLAPAPSGPVVPSETWGRGAIFGLMPLLDGRVYCYAAAHADPSADVPPLPAFEGWHAPIPDLVAGVPRGEVIASRLMDFATPLPSLSRGRVALVGDAAHPMTPFMGQGACQALEDAVTLASLVDPADVPGSLARYSAARLPRTTKIMKRSGRIGRLALLRSPVGIAVRNRVLGMAAGRLSEDRIAASFDDVFSWRLPEAPTRRAHLRCPPEVEGPA